MSWRGKSYLEDCDAPAHVKYLLVVLDQYADRDGRCHPGLDRLAAVMGKTTRSVQRARDEAVALYLMLYKPGRWKGHGGEYRLLAKGDAGVIHWDTQRVTKEAAKGWHIGPSKGDVGVYRTSKKSQEERDDAAASAGVGRALLQEVPPMAGESVACRDYSRHQSSHRHDSGKGWTCSVCDDLRRRRELAESIRSAPSDALRRRYAGTFGKTWGHLYGRAAA